MLQLHTYTSIHMTMSMLALYTQSTVQGTSRWLAHVLLLLRVLIAQSKEDTVTSRLRELTLNIYVHRELAARHRAGVYEHVMLDTRRGGSKQAPPPEQLLARYSRDVCLQSVDTDLKHSKRSRI